MADMKVLVFGATGAQGGPVVERLLRDGFAVRGAARTLPVGNPRPRYETVTVDLDDQAGTTAAATGTDAIFLHLPNVFDLDRGMRYLRHAVSAARSAGVARMVFSTSSGVPGDRTGVAMFDLRQAAVEYVLSSGLAVTVLRPTVYSASLGLPHLWLAASHQGIWPWPYRAEHAVSWASVDDQAAMVAAALARPATAGRVLDIGLPPITGDELADEVAAVAGRPVRYVAQDPDEFQHGLTGLIGPEAAQGVADVYRWHDRHGTRAVQVTDFGPTYQALGVVQTPLRTQLAALSRAATATSRPARPSATPAHR